MTKRRSAKGAGCIRRRKDGSYEGIVNINTASGKKVRRSVYGSSPRVVQQKIDELKRESHMGLIPDVRGILVSELVDSVIDNLSISLEPSTIKAYRTVAKNHINKHLGQIPVEKLTPLHVQNMLTAMSKQGLSPRLAYLVLHRVLEVGVDMGLAARNVASKVIKPKPYEISYTVLMPNQAQQLLAACKDLRERAWLLTDLSTGMRQGELFALHWNDIDLASGRISIRKTLSWATGEARLGTPKTKSSIRSILIPDITRAALVAYKAERDESGPPGPYVFSDSDGGPIRPNNFLRREFKPLLKRAGLPDMKFHELRHTAASLLLMQGVPVKYVSELLGHAHVSITLAIYGHLLPPTHQSAVIEMQKLLNPTDGESNSSS